MSLCPTIDVFMGYGNVTTLVPYADVVESLLLDMSGATRVEVCVGSVTTDSDTLPNAIWWEQEDALDPASRWLIKLKLGLVPAILEGSQLLRVVVYDNEYTNGVVLEHDAPLNVIGPC